VYSTCTVYITICTAVYKTCAYLLDLHHKPPDESGERQLIDSRDLSGRGAARAKDAQGTPTQSHISPSVLAYEDKLVFFNHLDLYHRRMNPANASSNQGPEKVDLILR